MIRLEKRRNNNNNNSNNNINNNLYLQCFSFSKNQTITSRVHLPLPSCKHGRKLNARQEFATRHKSDVNICKWLQQSSCIFFLSFFLSFFLNLFHLLSNHFLLSICFSLSPSLPLSFLLSLSPSLSLSYYWSFTPVLSGEFRWGRGQETASLFNTFTTLFSFGLCVVWLEYVDCIPLPTYPNPKVNKLSLAHRLSLWIFY